MTAQHTLLTCHKGVDLHAETAARVMRTRLHGGERLVALQRGEYHTFWEGNAPDLSIAGLLESGRYFNPNKHVYGHFQLQGGGEPWYVDETGFRGAPLAAGWPGEALATDCGSAGAALYDRLLGGSPETGQVAVDVCAFPLGERGPLLSGVIWRLVLEAGEQDVDALVAGLVVARSGREGLLVNPHMQGWLLGVQSGRTTAGRIRSVEGKAV
jgi:hypothetical protein